MRSVRVYPRVNRKSAKSAQNEPYLVTFLAFPPVASLLTERRLSIVSTIIGTHQQRKLKLAVGLRVVGAPMRSDECLPVVMNVDRNYFNYFISISYSKSKSQVSGVFSEKPE